MRSPVEVNGTLTQKLHFLLTIMLTFVIAALLALRQESNPKLKTDTGAVLPFSGERSACNTQPHKAHVTPPLIGGGHFRGASDGAPSAVGPPS